MTTCPQPNPAASPVVPECKRLYLVDGSGYIFRAYHSLPPLTRPDGTPVGAVYGFLNMMLKMIDSIEEGGYAAVIFDAGRKTFRNDIYPEYKAHRPPAPDDLIPQFSIVREAAQALNLPTVEQEGYEADDLIASYARAAQARGVEVVIVSSDKDLMQLVGDGIALLEPMRQKPIGMEQVMEKFGVPPEKVIEAQALIGDSSDNVPGVPGIGPKTAAELINQYGSLEGVLEHAHEIKQNKRRESLIEFAEQARISKQLVTLKDDMELPLPIDALHLSPPDGAVLGAFLREQGFKSLITRVESKFGAMPCEDEIHAKGDVTAPTENAEYELVTDLKRLKEWIADARYAGKVAVDTETTGLDAMRAGLVGISLAVEAGKACYIPLAHVGDAGEELASQPALPQGDLFSVQESDTPKLRHGQLPLKDTLALLKPLLEDESVLKIGQNIKYDLQILERYGICVSPVDDTMLLSYVLDAGLGNHGMDELARRHLGISTIKFSDVTGTGRSKITFAEVDLETARDYAAEDADITLRLHHLLKNRLIDERMVDVYETIERPLIPVLRHMEWCGIGVSLDHLRRLSDDFAARLGVLEKDIYQLAGCEFTIGSPKQLGEVLFEKLGLSTGRKSSKSGAYSTGADVLEELATSGHEVAERVLSWRQLAKLKSTYSDALAQQINPETGRVHTSYSMAVASTGRLSSSDPNLQNIPIRTEEGRKIRHAFIADDGKKLISADYSQIELRLLAHVADIAVLKEAFRDGRDIHATTASQMFGVPLDAVDGELRRKAKTINFGIIYGISAHGLSVRLGIGRKEAAQYIEQYFAQYPGIKAYMDEARDYAKKHGYVRTLYGRKVHLRDINAKNPNMRAFSERAAINAPLQGTAADIIKRAMVAVWDHLKAEFPEARMLLQVHDELLVEAPDRQAEAVAALVKQEMERAAHLSIPLTVDVSIGDDWGSIH